MSWRPYFFGWLRRQLIVVKDWPYADTDFTGDPDLPLPEGDYWDGELGMTHSLFDFIFYDFFLLIHVLPDTFYMPADVGPERPAGMSPISQRTLPAPDP